MKEAKIGPNAMIQTVEALKETYDSPKTTEILHAGGHAHLIDQLPSSMVSETMFIDLIQALVGQIGAEQTRQVLHRSGQRTGDYVLQYRIPRLFQRLLTSNILPRPARQYLLLAAISKSAWTFVGSGTFRFVGGKEPAIIISNQVPDPDPPLPPEICSFYQGTFEKLLQVLVDARATVRQRPSEPGSTVRCAYSIGYPG